MEEDEAVWHPYLQRLERGQYSLLLNSSGSKEEGIVSTEDASAFFPLFIPPYTDHGGGNY